MNGRSWSRRTVLGMSPLLAGCRPRGEAGSAALVVTADDARTTSTLEAYDTWSTALVHACTRRLFDYNSRAELVPDLAREVRRSPGGERYELLLKRGARFADETPITAEHFAAALESLRSPTSPSPGSSFYSALERVEPIAADRLVLTLSRPDPVLLNALAMTFASPLHPSRDLSQGGASGPYSLSGYEPGVAARLEPRQRDAVPLKIQFRVEEPLQLARMAGGEADLLPSVPPSMVGRLMASPEDRTRLVSQVVSQTWYFGMNTTRAPWNNQQVRRAVSLCLDRRRCARLAATGVAAACILPPFVPGHDPNRPLPEVDLTAARRLMEGAPAGDAGDLWLPNNATAVKMGQSIQADLRQIGIQVRLRSVTLSEYLTGYRTDAGCWFGGWYPDFPDAGNFLEPVLHRRSIKPGRSPNAARYSNPGADRLMDRAAGLVPGPERAWLYAEAEKLILAGNPWVPLYYESETRFRSPRLQGVTVHPVWRQILTGMRLGPE